MKLESTNIAIRANEDMNFATLTFKDSRNSELMLTHTILLEVRDLLNDYFQMLYESKEQDT